MRYDDFIYGVYVLCCVQNEFKGSIYVKGLTLEIRWPHVAKVMRTLLLIRIPSINYIKTNVNDLAS